MLLYEESDRWARASIALGERRSFPAAIATGNEFLAENMAGRGHWDASLAYAARDHEQAAKIGSLARTAWSEFCKAQSLHGKGQLREGLDAALTALRLCEQIGEERLATWLEPTAAIIAADMGDDAEARAHAERAWAHARRLDQLLLSAWALHGLGYAAMQRGDVQEALEWYGQYVPLVRETENAVSRHLVLGRAAEAFLRAGRIEEATRLVEQAMTIALFARAPHYHAVAQRVQGEIFATQDRDDDALRAFDQAIAAFEQNGSRLEHARALYQRAALRSDRAEAVRARDAFAAIGAERDRALAEQLL
jgi:tetratricopeptide (TPR) repeat protein